MNDATLLPSLIFTPEVFQKINPKGYHTKFLENGLRATGRNVETFRPVFINNDKLGSTSASSVVRMGNTIVVCGISTEIGELAIDLPQQGWVVPNLQLDAISLASHKSGLPSSQAQSITFQISQLIKTSDLLDLHSLLIEHSKSAWAIYIDLICLNDDGNLFDAAWLSLVSALRDVKLPKATWDTDAKQVVLDTTMKSPLSLSTILTFTYGFFDDKFILADPDKEEETLLLGTICFALDSNGELRHLSRIGKASCTEKSLAHLKSSAERQFEELNGKLK